MRGCEKGSLDQVPETEGVAGLLRDIRRTQRNRQDRSRDDVPVIGQLDGNDRLHIQGVTRPAERTDAEVDVVLKGHADEVRDRVLHGPLELFELRLAGVLWLLRRLPWLRLREWLVSGEGRRVRLSYPGERRIPSGRGRRRLRACPAQG
jgi:hypothetical protein